MRSKWIGSLFVCVLTLGALAPSAASQTLDEDDVALTANYFGETVLHGGATVGAEAYLMERGSYKMILAPNIGWYLHPRNHHGAFVDLQWGGRLTADFGLFGDAFLGLGYFHRFPDGDIYQVEEDGTLDGQANTGNPNLMGSAYLGVGWDLEKNGVAPLNLHLRFGGFGEWPFTATDVILPHFVTQAGLAYKF